MEILEGSFKKKNTVAVTVNILCERAPYDKNSFQDLQSFYQNKQFYLNTGVCVEKEKNNPSENSEGQHVLQGMAQNTF